MGGCEVGAIDSACTSVRIPLMDGLKSLGSVRRTRVFGSYRLRAILYDETLWWGEKGLKVGEN